MPEPGSVETKGLKGITLKEADSKEPHQLSRREVLEHVARIATAGAILGTVPGVATLAVNALKDSMVGLAVDSVEGYLDDVGSYELTGAQITDIYKERDNIAPYSEELINAVLHGTPVVIDGKVYPLAMTRDGENQLFSSYAGASSLEATSTVGIENGTPVIGLQTPDADMMRETAFFDVVDGKLCKKGEIPADRKERVDAESKAVAHMIARVTEEHEAFHGATNILTICSAAQKLGIDLSVQPIGPSGELVSADRFIKLSPEERAQLSYTPNGNAASLSSQQLENALLQPYLWYLRDSLGALKHKEPRLGFSDEPRAYVFEAVETLKALQKNGWSMKFDPDLSLRERMRYEQERYSRLLLFPYHSIRTSPDHQVLIPGAFGFQSAYTHFGTELQAANYDWGTFTQQNPRFSDLKQWGPYAKKITSFYTANVM